MTNRELIERLQQMPPDEQAKVYLGWDDVYITINKFDNELVADMYPVEIRLWDGRYEVCDTYYPNDPMTNETFATAKEAEAWVDYNGFVIGRIN